MNKKFASLFCATLMVGSASLAFAGAYGEREEPTEMPAPAPAPRAAAAAEVEEEFRAGPYFGVGGIYALEFFDIDRRSGIFVAGRDVGFPGRDGDETYDNSWGYKAYAGYRIAPMFAVEAMWEHFLNFRSDEGTFANFGNDAGADQYAWMLSVGGKFFPIQGMVEPYIGFAAGWEYTDAKDQQNPVAGVARGFNGDALALRPSLGVDIYFMDNMGMNLDVAYIWPVWGDPASADIDILPFSASLFFRF